MQVTVVAVLCHLLNGQPICQEEIVTDSIMDETVDFQGCMVHGQFGLADWKSKHPIYFKESWYIERYKCVPGVGQYQPKNHV